MAKVQVYIATYNRPNLLIRAIKSILDQTYNDFELIVSDNSTNSETYNIIKSTFIDFKFKYIKRNPSLNSIDHFNMILNEISSEYFMIFHDDDVMHTNMLEVIMKKFELSTEIIAIGSNAVKINKKLNNKSYFLKLKNDLLLTCQIDMIKQYLNGIITPFPSYVYKKSVSENIKFNVQHGGKYCDSAFIIELLNLGSVLYSKDTVMDYYIYKEQDSNSHSFTESNKLLSFMLKLSNIDKKSTHVENFRLRNIYCELFWNSNKSLNKYYFIKLLAYRKKYKLLYKCILRCIYGIITK